MKYKGHCHCGKVAFEVEGEIDSALSCNCSICSRKGALLWAVPRDNLTLLTPEDVQTASPQLSGRSICRKVSAWLSGPPTTVLSKASYGQVETFAVQDAIDDWQLLLQDRRKRHISLSPVRGGLVQPASTPARVVTDDTLRDRATPAGVYLVTDMPTLIEEVCLAPSASVPVRHAVLAATERFGLDRHVISESETDLVPPDDIAFVP